MARPCLPVGFVFINTYSSSPDDAVKHSDMSITGGKSGLNKITDWVTHLNMKGAVYHDKTRDRRGTARNIRKALKAQRTVPTFIHLSGHGARFNGENVYLASDCIRQNRFATDKMISYSEMRTLLTAQSNPAPLVLVTDVCLSDNFLRLPYMLHTEEGDPRWAETEYAGDGCLSPKAIPIMAHFSTGCQAGTWPKPSSCGMFTQAFYNLTPDNKLSLGDILHRIRLNVGQLLNDHDPGNEIYLHAQYKVYCSHKFDDAHFFEALGFELEHKNKPCAFDFGHSTGVGRDGIGQNC